MANTLRFDVSNVESPRPVACVSAALTNAIMLATRLHYTKAHWADAAIVATRKRGDQKGVCLECSQTTCPGKQDV